MKQFNTLWKFVVGGGTVLGYQAFYDRMINRKETELKDSIKSINDKLDSLTVEINKSNYDKKEILDSQNSIKEAKNSLQDLINIHEKYYEKFDEITEHNDEKSKNLFESYKKEIYDAFNKSKEITDNISKKHSDLDSINKFNDSNNDYIKNLIKEFNDYLSNLSTTEICLVINITSCLFVLTCLFTILLAVYGNFILNKLSLEKKYPKLATFIKLRIKLQHTYVITNVLLILVVVVLMVIINFITLTNF